MEEKEEGVGQRRERSEGHKEGRERVFLISWLFWLSVLLWFDGFRCLPLSWLAAVLLQQTSWPLALACFLSRRTLSATTTTTSSSNTNTNTETPHSSGSTSRSNSKNEKLQQKQRSSNNNDDCDQDNSYDHDHDNGRNNDKSDKSNKNDNKKWKSQQQQYYNSNIRRKFRSQTSDNMDRWKAE